MSQYSIIDDLQPGRLVEILDQCAGDLQKFADVVAPSEIATVVVMRAEYILAQSESGSDYLKWNRLIQARNQARFKVAQQKAFARIEAWDFPKDKEGHELPITLQTMLSYVRFWFGAESAGQTARARKDATSTAGSGELDQLDSLFNGLSRGG